jgi:multicomponent Na+:H+ antiporter subunit F
MDTALILEYTVIFCLGLLTLSMIFPFIRLFKGPSLPDRVVALDQIALIMVAIMLLDIVLSGEKVFMDVVLIISFILTLGTMIINKFLFKRVRK